jgi:hypothetical protein
MLRVLLYKNKTIPPDDRNLLKDHDSILVKNLPGPFQPDGKTPVFVIDPNDDMLFPDVPLKAGHTPFMFGNIYASSSDNRFTSRFGFKAIPVMDWSTNWEEYNQLTQ